MCLDLLVSDSRRSLVRKSSISDLDSRPEVDWPSVLPDSPSLVLEYDREGETLAEPYCKFVSPSVFPVDRDENLVEWFCASCKSCLNRVSSSDKANVGPSAESQDWSKVSNSFFESSVLVIILSSPSVSWCAGASENTSPSLS